MKQPVNATSGVHFIHPNVRDGVVTKGDENDHVMKKASILTLTGIIYMGMHNNGDANWLQYIFAQ